MSKIDTQGLSGPVDPNYKGPVGIQTHKPMMILIGGKNLFPIIQVSKKNY